MTYHDDQPAGIVASDRETAARLVDLLEADRADTAEQVMAMVRDRRAWGAQLLLDMFGCATELITSTDAIREYADKLCKLIDMRPYGQPLVPLFGLADPKTHGHSLVQLIETSLVDAHFTHNWDDFAAINVHSCQPFDVAAVVAFSRDFFLAVGPVTWRLSPRGIRR